MVAGKCDYQTSFKFNVHFAIITSTLDEYCTLCIMHMYVYKVKRYYSKEPNIMSWKWHFYLNERPLYRLAESRIRWWHNHCTPAPEFRWQNRICKKEKTFQPFPQRSRHSDWPSVWVFLGMGASMGIMLVQLETAVWEFRSSAWAPTLWRFS